MLLDTVARRHRHRHRHHHHRHRHRHRHHHHRHHRYHRYHHHRYRHHRLVYIPSPSLILSNITSMGGIVRFSGTCQQPYTMFHDHYVSIYLVSSDDRSFVVVSCDHVMLF